MTVLSRCLQFSLKPLTPAQIEARIDHILREEGIEHESGAVALLARAAHGSLRDGLSLLDQAIAFGGGEVREEAVRTMLGAVDRDYVYRIADALAAGDGVALLAECDALDRARTGVRLGAGGTRRHCFTAIAVAQAVPDAAGTFDDARAPGRIRRGLSRRRPCSSTTRSRRRAGPTWRWRRTRRPASR